MLNLVWRFNDIEQGIIGRLGKSGLRGGLGTMVTKFKK